MMENDKKVNVSEQISTVIANVSNYFISAAFIMWGWNVIAPHLNAPIFTYWEIFGMRMALGYILGMFKRKIE